MFRIEGEADTGRAIQFFAVDQVGLLQTVGESRGQLFCDLRADVRDEGDEFVTPFCCYGNDVDCDLCGAWAVFYIAAKLEAAEPAA